MPSVEERRKPTRPRRARRGFSLIELLVVIAIILIIATLAIPQLIRSRVVANEAAAVSALRTLSSANLIYSNTYQQGYAANLAALGPPAGGPPSANGADLIDSLLANGTRNGYAFLYNPMKISGTGWFDQYTVNANPLSPMISGQRYFFVDQSNVVRFDLNGPANANSTPVPAK